MGHKQVYQTNPDGIFIGVVLADESPLEEGVFHIPFGAIEEPPPFPIPNGKQARWADGQWVIETPPPPPPPEDGEEPGPGYIRDITKRQLRLWLLKNKGKRIDDVRAAIEQVIEDPAEREVILIELEDATSFKRTHPMFEVLGPLLGLSSSEEIDQAFREAFEL